MAQHHSILAELVLPLSDMDTRRRLRSTSTAKVLVPATRRATIGDFTAPSLSPVFELEQFALLL